MQRRRQSSGFVSERLKCSVGTPHDGVSARGGVGLYLEIVATCSSSPLFEPVRNDPGRVAGSDVMVGSC